MRIAGEQFLTNQSLSFDVICDGLEIPHGTLFTIVEVDEDEMPFGFKVYFEGFGNEEMSWVRLSEDEIEDIRQSSMVEY